MTNTDAQLYQVTVNFSMSPQDMVKACGFIRVTPKIRLEDLSVTKNGKLEVNMKLFSIERKSLAYLGVSEEDLIEVIGSTLRYYIPTGAILELNKEQGFRPATIIELLAFGATKLDMPQFPQAIFALGTTFQDTGGHPLVPHIDALGGGRNLGLHFGYEDLWECSQSFLFLFTQMS